MLVKMRKIDNKTPIHLLNGRSKSKSANFVANQTSFLCDEHDGLAKSNHKKEIEKFKRFQRLEFPITNRRHEFFEIKTAKM